MRCCIHNCSSRLRDEASLVEDANIQALLRILDMVPDDFRVLAAAFEEDGNVEIDGIIEASSMGERSNSNNNINDDDDDDDDDDNDNDNDNHSIINNNSNNHNNHKQQAASNKQQRRDEAKYETMRGYILCTYSFL